MSSKFVERAIRRFEFNDSALAEHWTLPRRANARDRRGSVAAECFLRGAGAGPASANLDIFWLEDESLEDSANLPDPDIIAAEIVEDLQAALAPAEPGGIS